MADDGPTGHEPGSTRISDDDMRAMLAKAGRYTLVLLKATPSLQRPEVDAIIWEHGRRNFALRAEGVLAVVCPVADDTELSGIGIFDATPEETARIMDADPGVKAGIFTYEVHPVRGLPGDRIPPATAPPAPGEPAP